MQSEIQRIKNTFDNNNIPVSVEWLEECIAWCRSEVLGASYTTDQLKDATHDQWLLLDLRDIESPVLPPGLSEKKYMLLDGNFSLQVMQVVDVSKPKYWQIQQIRKENILTRPSKNETDDNVGSGKRVLQLTLTDGVQYVEAMEYKPITILNINLTPGMKVRLSGPITIRRGRLMLQDKNIRLLGGEVESLLVSNAAENILAKALQLPENLNPQVVDVNLLSVDQEEGNTQQASNPRNVPNINSRESTSRNIQNNYKEYNQVTTATVQNEDYLTDEDFEMLIQAENLLHKNASNLSKAKQQNSASQSNDRNKISDYSEEEIELLMEVERVFDDKSKNNARTNRNKTPDLFEDDFTSDQIDNLLEMTNKISKTNFDKKPSVQNNTAPLKSSTTRNALQGIIQPASTAQPIASKANLFDEFINEDDLFSNINIDYLENQKFSENRSDIISITQLNKHLQQANTGSFKVRAKFKSVIEKLTLDKQEYKLIIMIQDESNEIICRVDSDVVSKWAGFTPVEIINLKTNIFSQDVESKKKVEKALQNIKDLLVVINHVMEIEIVGKDTVPVIKNIVY